MTPAQVRVWPRARARARVRARARARGLQGVLFGVCVHGVLFGGQRKGDVCVH